jgi:uncharacterized protein (TIGR03000 family)
MYSVVLLMALSGGAQAPDAHGCHGCSGYCGGGYVSYCGGSYCGGGYCGGYVSYGCSCSGSCHGGRHHRRGHGCHGCSGCSGYSSCCGSYYGCSGYGGCTGYIGCTGCSGGVIYPPPPGKPGEKLDMPKEKKDGKDKEEVNAPATLIVSVPADAKILIDGAATTSTSATRTFVTPELVPAKTFVYTLTAEVVRDGQKLTASEKVTVRAGEETRVNFAAEKFTATTVAAK